MTDPRISVIMPAHNAARYIAEAIGSVLGQTLRELELIVIDDGSTDRTAAIVAEIAQRDDRLRLLRLEHRGIVNVNVGVEAARCDLVGRCDADDISLPTRFEKQLAYMEAHPECAAVGCWLQRTDPFGSPTGQQHPPTEHADIDAALLAGDGSAIVQGASVYRREALRRCGGWRDDYGWIEDLNLFLRLGEVGKLANIPEVLYSYRRHVASVCAVNYDAMRSKIEALLREVYQRRGMDGKPNLARLRPDLMKQDSPAQTMRHWACHAIEQHNGRIARRHAWAALCREPWSIQSWKVLRWALAA